jgi:hypothetical protein
MAWAPCCSGSVQGGCADEQEEIALNSGNTYVCYSIVDYKIALLLNNIPIRLYFRHAAEAAG